MTISRRALLAGMLAITGGLAARASAASKPPVTVYKSPTCGCCKLWVTHLQQHGFTVTPVDLESLAAVKKRHGVPDKLASCHTAVVDGYVVEGHVPADLIDRLLRERPPIVGIAVPGMPIGSPGMEVAGQPAERYQILTFDKSGASTVFATR
jgi:hypothetical protein